MLSFFDWSFRSQSYTGVSAIRVLKTWEKQKRENLALLNPGVSQEPPAILLLVGAGDPISVHCPKTGQMLVALLRSSRMWGHSTRVYQGNLLKFAGCGPEIWTMLMVCSLCPEARSPWTSVNPIGPFLILSNQVVSKGLWALGQELWPRIREAGTPLLGRIMAHGLEAYSLERVIVHREGKARLQSPAVGGYYREGC